MIVVVAALHAVSHVNFAAVAAIELQPNGFPSGRLAANHFWNFQIRNEPPEPLVLWPVVADFIFLASTRKCFRKALAAIRPATGLRPSPSSPHKSSTKRQVSSVTSEKRCG